MKAILIFAAVVLSVSTASAQSSIGSGGFFGGGMTGTVTTNVGPIRPGGPCPINMKCGQTIRSLDPNAPIPAKPTAAQLKARRALEAAR
jgi:hypothetical protein